jgi:succinoglycan biosynthesis transport protein ExoP
MATVGKPPESRDSAHLDLATVFRVAVKRWRLVVFVMTFVVLAAGFFVGRHPRIYLATATVKIDPDAIRPLGRDVATPGDSTNFYWANKEYYETEYQILSSRKVTERVVQVLGLNRDIGFLGSVLTAKKPSEKRPDISVTEAAEVLSQRLIIEPEKKSRLVKVSIEDVDPKRAQLIVNNVTTAYNEQNLNASLTNIGSAADWLNDQLIKLKAELESSELALHEYKKEKRLLSASLDDQSNMLRNEMEQLHQALTAARTRREQLASHVEQLNRVNSEDPTDLPSSELLNSETLRGLREAYVSSRTEHSKLLSGGKGEEHPDVKRAQSEMVGTRTALLDEVRNIKEAFQRDLSAIDREIGGVSGLYQKAEQQAFDLNLLEIEYKRLARSRENTERLHSIVLERAKESELGSQMRFNNVSVVEAALLPKDPVKPRVGFIMVGGVFLGLLLGFLAALLNEKLRQRLDTPEDLEEQLLITCVATIPQVGLEPLGSLHPLGQKKRRSRAAAQSNLDSPELYVHRHPTSNAAEAVRALRTNLIFMSPDRPYKKLLITSAGPTDGKTTIAASLAATLAHAGERVLLIDADLRKPRLSSVLGAGRSSQGVTTATIDPSTLANAVVQTEVENMMLLATGPLPPNPSELLQSERFHTLLVQAGEQFDRIIIDSPPLVAVTDAAILSTRVDATLLVVRSGQTRREHARQALRALKDVNANIAGAVLNGVKKRPGSDYYYYGYYAQSSENAETKA